MNPLVAVRIAAGYPGRPNVIEEAAFEMAPGEILGLVGRSGEGKSTIAMAILKLLELRGGSVRGEIYFQGRELTGLPEREMRRLRGREMALVPQSPIASLNPALTIGAQFREAWSAHESGPFRDFELRLRELMASVSLPTDPAFLGRYPRELSVGLAQRVLIAMALIHRPALILADEPTSALDMITQSEILKLVARLNREMRMGILYISHDLLSIAAVCHRVAILHQGRIAECGTVEQIFHSPRHPHTQMLIDAMPGRPR